MDNPRLLTGLLVATLLSSVVSAAGPNAVVIPLEDIFATAESNSIKLLPSFTAEKEARQEISIAKSQRLPDIHASLSFSYIGDGFITKRNFSYYQKAPIPHFGNSLSLSITQPVYAGGAITNSIKLAELRSTATRFATKLQRDNIRLQLTGLYLDIYKYSNLKKVVENNIDQANTMLHEMRARYDQGVALQNDITRYELLVSNLDLQLIKINNTLDILNNNLVITAGLPKDIKITPDSTILSRAIPSATETWWQDEATTCAPSLQLAKSGIDISRKAESLVRSERLPKIGLQAAWTIDGPILVEVPPINRNLSYWYVGIGISYNLSSLYKTNKSMSKSRLSTQKAIEEYESTREDIEIAVRTDYTHYLEAYEELKTRQKGVELADRNYRTISTRYSADMALITDMLDAANSKLDAEQQLVNARINIIYYYYKLLFTTGKI